MSRIYFLEDEEIAPYLPAASTLTSDSKDRAYVACALVAGADLWNKDRHLRNQRIKCWSTEELAKKLLKQ